MTNNIIATLILLGSIQGAIVAIFLFFTKLKANKILSTTLIIISITLFIVYLQSVVDITTHTYLIKLTLPASLIFIPTLMLYIRSLTDIGTRYKQNMFYYFVPAIMVILYNIPFFFDDLGIKIAYYQRAEINSILSFSEKTEELFINLIVFIFSVMTLHFSLRFKKNAEQVLSEVSSTKIRWIEFLAWSMVILTFLAFSLATLQAFDINYPSVLNLFSAFGAIFVIYAIAAFALIKPELFIKYQNEIIQVQESAKKKEKNDSEQWDELHKNLTEIIEHEKLYRDPDLSLSTLAEKAGMPPYILSKCINTVDGNNFYSFINGFRLKEVKSELLKREDTKKSIIEIAFDAGFNTKSSFYDFFKKNTGVSPSEYIQQKNNLMKI